MKNLLFINLFIFSTFCFSQDEKKEIESLKKVIESLKVDTARYLKENKQLKIDVSNNKSKIETLNGQIKNVNNVFLKSLFIDKYLNNSPYLKTTDLSSTDDRSKIDKWNLLLKSLERTIVDKDTLGEIKKALDFNTNYSKLFEIKSVIFGVKYDSLSMRNALKEIEKLPKLNEDWKLNETKEKIKNLLLNYESNSCLLKEFLDKLKDKDQNLVQTYYIKYENDKRFIDYKYLVDIIKDIKKDVNSYTSEDLAPCKIEKKEEKTTDKVEPELKKETTPLEVKEPEKK
jgi:hypothetical protein